MTEVAKQLRFSCAELPEIQIKVQLMTDWGLEAVWGGSVSVSMLRSGAALRLRPAALLRCSAAPLHASHLQGLASIVETRTIFN